MIRIRRMSAADVPLGMRLKEQAGWNLFRGKARCNTCHLDGTSNRGTPPPGPNHIMPAMMPSEQTTRKICTFEISRVPAIW